MSRYCICGCGKELLDHKGFTDYERKFFDSKCLGKDKSQRIRDQRARTKDAKRCSHCGQVIPPKIKAAEA